VMTNVTHLGNIQHQLKEIRFLDFSAMSLIMPVVFS
jgi:hypothetical protein